MQPLRRLGRHVGRRGAYLLFLALLDITVAYSLTQPLPLGLTRGQVYRPFTDLAPFAVWVWTWAGVGLLAFAAAFVHGLRVAVFGAAALMKVAWAAGYLSGWVSGYPLYTRGYQTAAIYVAFAAVTLIVSGWRENSQ